MNKKYYSIIMLLSLVVTMFLPKTLVIANGELEEKTSIIQNVEEKKIDHKQNYYSKVSYSGQTQNPCIVNATVKKKESNIKTVVLKPTDTVKSPEVLDFVLTFYTDLAEENGGYAGLNAQGGSLSYGQVASNVYAFGTQIEIEGLGVMVVADRGGSHFDSPNRLDIFIPRLKGESDSVYKKRVNNLGKQKVIGSILK